MYELCNEQLTMFLLRASIHPSVSRVLATVRWTGGGDAIFFQNRTFPSPVSFLSSSSRVPYFFFHETAQYESTRGVAESGERVDPTGHAHGQWWDPTSRGGATGSDGGETWRRRTENREPRPPRVAPRLPPTEATPTAFGRG